jgi:hypothetical protein
LELTQKLEQDIERARYEMVLISKKYPLSSSEVVVASQKLDDLMNKHYELKAVYEK